MSQNAIEIGETGNAEDRMLNGCSTAQRMHLVPWTLDMVLRNLEMSMGKALGCEIARMVAAICQIGIANLWEEVGGKKS